MIDENPNSPQDSSGTDVESNNALSSQNLENRLLQIKTAADITQLTVSAKNQNELLRRTVELLVERFGYYYTSVFLVDELQKVAVLSEAHGVAPDVRVATGYRLEAGSSSIIGWVMDNRQSYVTCDVKIDDHYLEVDNLPSTRSEVALPVIANDKLLAVLDIQHTISDAFDPETVIVLQTIANHIAITLQNLRLLESFQNNLSEISSLFQASHQLAQAKTSADVISTIQASLYRSPFVAAIFSVDRKGLHVVTNQQTDHTNSGGHQKRLPFPDRIDCDPGVLVDLIGSGIDYKIVDLSDSVVLGQELPAVIRTIPSDSGCRSIVFIPGWNGDKLELLIILGIKNDMQVTRDMLEPYCSLADMAILTLSKVASSHRLEKRLSVLQTLNTVSQAVSVETDLNEFYQVVQHEVASIIGKVNFAVAIYDSQHDTIAIPYMFDGQTTRSVDTFPMGEGLTSILIRTKKSLLVVEDTERKTRELGAKMVGKPAKSWLGVPLLVGGEVIGAILLQDLEQESRFDEDDQLLMETLAAQVAVAIRNARLLEETYQQAYRQQQLYEITSKIRNSPDISSILKTTASELGRVLGAQRTKIELGTVSPALQEIEPPES